MWKFKKYKREFWRKQKNIKSIDHSIEKILSDQLRSDVMFSIEKDK
jgi:hypothetical protein